MAELPARPDLDQLRHQAKDLLRAVKRGDQAAVSRVRAVSGEQTLASAQLAVAREHGFASWARLKTEVERRQILDDRDVARLTALVAEHPELAVSPMIQWSDHRLGATPLGYVAMLRYDTATCRWRDVARTGALAEALLAAGAPVDGAPGDSETPLITAASYGDAEVAQVLIDAGADLDATASPSAGGVPGGTALRHAAVFGMTGVLDVLVAAGARVGSIAEAGAAGDITGWLRPDTPEQDRAGALVMAADHQRLDVIDQLLQAGTPIDAEAPWGRQALRQAALNGRVASVEHLLARGADPDHRDPTENLTALEWTRRSDDSPRRAQVRAILAPVTRPSSQGQD
jgi:ankyrin repeat protein